MSPTGVSKFWRFNLEILPAGAFRANSVRCVEERHVLVRQSSAHGLRLPAHSWPTANNAPQAPQGYRLSPIRPWQVQKIDRMAAKLLQPMSFAPQGHYHRLSHIGEGQCRKPVLLKTRRAKIALRSKKQRRALCGRNPKRMGAYSTGKQSGACLCHRHRARVGKRTATGEQGASSRRRLGMGA